MNELPIFVRQGLAIGLLAVALLFSWSFVLHPLYLATKLSIEELDDARFELQRLAILAEDAATTTPDTILSELDTLQTQLFAMRTASDTDAHFLTAVDQLIRSSGIRLLQLKAGVPSRAGILTRYTVDINAAGHESDIARLLSGIEQHRPLLVIDHAALLSQGSPFADFDTAPVLSVQLRLSGFGADINLTESQGRKNAR